MFTWKLQRAADDIIVESSEQYKFQIEKKKQPQLRRAIPQSPFEKIIVRVPCAPLSPLNRLVVRCWFLTSNLNFLIDLDCWQIYVNPIDSNHDVVLVIQAI